MSCFLLVMTFAHGTKYKYPPYNCLIIHYFVGSSCYPVRLVEVWVRRPKYSWVLKKPIICLFDDSSLV